MTRRRYLSLLILLSFLAAPLFAQKKIVIRTNATNLWAFDDEALARYRRAAGDGVRIVVADSAEALAREVADADAVVGGITPDAFGAAKKLAWVQQISAGVEAYTFWPEFVESEVTLTNCKIVQGPTIADHAFAMLLSLTRGLNGFIRDREKQEWSRDPGETDQLTELPGMTAVVIGVGGIGTQIAQRAHGFGMRVIGVDPKDIPPSPFVERIVRPDRLDEVLPLADVVFVSAPHTPRSEKMVGARQFDLMKRGAYFIAVSRGKLYDGQALTKALDSQKLAGAGLDVTDPEPLPKGHPLWQFENVIITPHIASRAEGSNVRRRGVIEENIGRFSRGEGLINVVDKKKGY